MFKCALDVSTGIEILVIPVFFFLQHNKLINNLEVRHRKFSLLEI